MKKNLLKRTATMLLVLCLLASLGLAYAVDTSDHAVARAGYTYARAELSISSTGEADCYGQLRLLTNYTASGTLTLQKKDGDSWTELKTWSASGSGSVSCEKTWYVTSGNTYRVEYSMDIYNASGTYVDTATAYSSIVNY